MPKLYGRTLQRFIVCLGLAILVVLAYWPVRHNGFIGTDDPDYLTQNPRVSTGLTAAGVRWAFTTFHAANWHPLTWLSHMLDCQLWGLNAAHHHEMNVALHALTAALLFLVLLKMTRRVGFSAFVAALFAVHPLQVESVAWAAERKDVLSTLFFVLTIGCYVWFLEKRSVFRYLLVIVVFLLGLLSKPMLVTLPFVLLLLDYWPLQRLGPKAVHATKLRTLIVEKIPLFVLVIASSIITFFAQRSGGAVATVANLPFDFRIQNVVISYARYLMAFAWPVHLAAFYPFPREYYSAAQVVAAAIVLLGITACAMVFYRRRYLAVGWFWFLGTLVPVIGLVQVGLQSRADRYMHIPLIGLAIMIGGFGDELARRLRLHITPIAVSAAAIIACCILTWRQVGYWKNGETLFTHSLQVTPDNLFARMCLGVSLCFPDRAHEAHAQFARAAELQPDYAPAYAMLGRVAMMLKETDQAKQYLTMAEKFGPGDPPTLAAWGDLKGEEGDYPAAIGYYRRSLAAKPEQPAVIYSLALALYQVGNFDAAEQFIRQTLDINPRSAEAHYQLAMLLLKRHADDEARAQLETSVALLNDAPQPQYELAMLLLRKGKVADAVPHLREAVRLEPKSAPALQNLAWILATHPDAAQRNPAEALKLSLTANEVTDHKRPAILDTLAAAYAANGSYDKAVETAKKAADLADEAHDTALAARIRSRAETYSQHKPFVDTSLR